MQRAGKTQTEIALTIGTSQATVSPEAEYYVMNM